MFTFKPYQIDDIARAATHDGAILSWDPGLGKTLGGLSFALVKGGKRNLLVVPAGLIKQWQDEASEKFALALRPLLSQEDFYADSFLRPGATAPETPAFWITSFEALGYNGGDEWPVKYTADDEVIENKKLNKSRASHPVWAELETSLDENAVDKLRRNFTDEIGTVSEHGIKCVFTPTLSTLIAQGPDGCAFDCVIVDEGVRLKSNDSFIATGVRQLDPDYRLVLTGTPVKNLLDDIFWLAQWACGGHTEATARWPYENTTEAREQFANSHMLIERNLTKEEEAAAKGKRRRYTKRTPTICNIHRLWKLLGPVVIRRRKDECGESIVKKTFIPVTVRPGMAQQEVYQFHLKNTPVDMDSKAAANLATMQALRQAALCPDSPNLAEINYGDIPGPRRSWTDFNPKNISILSLITDMLGRGEQVVILSPFTQFSITLENRLKEAGVKCARLDGHISPKKRGILAASFKRKEYPVLIGGLESMAEGHSFDKCWNIILPSLTWALDKNLQGIDRVHRLISKRDVNVYIMVTENSIDSLILSRFNEKKDSAGLALDGHLTEEAQSEIDMGALLREAVSSFDAKAPTLDERLMDEEWPRLKARLAHAQTAFDEFHPPVVTDSEGSKPSRKEVVKAVKALKEPEPIPLTTAEKLALAQRLINSLSF